MKHILEYSSFYKIGDKVLIEYWWNDLIVPVIITDKSGNKYTVSHNIEESQLKNAPEQVISSSEIIDHFRN